MVNSPIASYVWGTDHQLPTSTRSHSRVYPRSYLRFHKFSQITLPASFFRGCIEKSMKKRQRLPLVRPIAATSWRQDPELHWRILRERKRRMTRRLCFTDRDFCHLLWQKKKRYAKSRKVNSFRQRCVAEKKNRVTEEWCEDSDDQRNSYILPVERREGRKTRRKAGKRGGN